MTPAIVPTKKCKATIGYKVVKCESLETLQSIYSILYNLVKVNHVEDQFKPLKPWRLGVDSSDDAEPRHGGKNHTHRPHSTRHP